MHTKKVFICILISLTLLFVSCGNTDNKDPNKEAIQTGEDIIKCIKSQNANEIKDMFCSYVLSYKKNIEKEIESAFAFIDGEIVSYDEPFPMTVGSQKAKSYGARIDNVKTDKGTTYTISFHGEFRNENDKSVEGVRYIKIINETKKAHSSDKIEYMAEIGLYEFSKEKMDEIF